MRLLKCLPGDGDFELTTFDNNTAPPYAILSHTWTADQEVTYKEFLDGTGTNKLGYAKLRFCGERAAADDLEYFWVDTCCINKATSDELSTAINSMFYWYQRAAKCYVYLTDVSVPEEVTDPAAFCISWKQAFRRSRWFTRGWTLQELLAPTSVEFFSREGKLLGSRNSLEQEIQEITAIPTKAIRGQKLSSFSIEERMSWAAGRTTTMAEDRIYCLLGIFGVFLPLIYGEGEDYASLRLREEIQKRQQGTSTDLQGMPSASFPASLLLPFPRNELFVGRQSQLESLKHSLCVPKSHRRMTLYGLGGCGKSALVLEFAYRVLAECLRDLVFWVPAMSRESFELAYREIAIRLRLPGVTDPNTNINKLVKETLSADRFSWLMIVDNADDPAILLGLVDGDPDSLRLGDYLPSSCRGAVLFTTRSRKAARTLTSSCVLALEDMSQSEARELLTQHMTNEVVLNDPSTAIDQLLSTLAYLPLAIVQAAAYINNNDILISDYMSLFQHAGAEIELFSEQFEDLGGYPEKDNTVARTWNISFDQIRKQDPLAAEYLSFMACISRSNIPQSLLPLHGSAVERIRALGTLTGYAFITERQTLQGVERERFFDMHRLVHVASTEWLHGSGEWASWAHTVVHRLEELVPCGGHNGKEIWAPYLAHAVHVAALGSLVGEKARASLLDRVGWCQTSLGQYAAAEISHKQAISLRRQVLGHEHPDTLISMSSLALVLKKQGRYRESEILNRETLAQREKVLGQKDPVTLASLHNLALVLDRQGKYHEAEAMNRQALAHKEEVLGYEHPDTLMSLTSLAGVLDKQGRYEEAEAMHRQTLAQKKKVFGHEHPETLLSMNNLAMVLDRQGKYEEAETIHRQTLAQTEKVLGKHPDMLTSMNNLAMVLDRQGKHKEAEAIHRQTLVQRKEVLGHTHPDTLTSMHNLAIVLDKQGKHKEAEAIYRQTLTHRKEVLGDAHPDTLVTLYCLAQFLTAQRCYDESFALYERACAGYTTALGTHHPTTRACHQHYAAALALQDQAQSVVPPTKPDSGQVAQKGKGSKLLRGLAKIGIRSSKPATR